MFASCVAWDGDSHLAATRRALPTNFRLPAGDGACFSVQAGSQSYLGSGLGPVSDSPDPSGPPSAWPSSKGSDGLGTGRSTSGPPHEGQLSGQAAKRRRKADTDYPRGGLLPPPTQSSSDGCNHAQLIFIQRHVLPNKHTALLLTPRYARAAAVAVSRPPAPSIATARTAGADPSDSSDDDFIPPNGKALTRSTSPALTAPPPSATATATTTTPPPSTPATALTPLLPAGSARRAAGSWPRWRGRASGCS